MKENHHDLYFEEFIRQTIEHGARQSQLADPNFKHTPSCIEAKRIWKEHDRKWVKRWPEFCRHCGGIGSISSYDDAFRCPECAEKNLCPRCAANLPDGEGEGEWPCCACSFDGDPERPEEPACNCSGVGKTERKPEHPI